MNILILIIEMINLFLYFSLTNNTMIQKTIFKVIYYWEMSFFDIITNKK